MWLTGKDSDVGKDSGHEKGATEDEAVGWHHWLRGHEFEQTPGDGEGQGSLLRCSPWGCKESDTTEQLNNKQQKVGGEKDDPWGKEKEYILSTRFYVYVNTVEVHNTEKTNQNYHSVRGGSLARWRQGQECDFTRYSLQVLFFWFWGFFGHGSKHVESYFTDQGWNLRPLQRKWKHGVLTAEPPEKFPTGSEICGSVACSKIKKKKKRKPTKTPLMAHPY